MADISRAFHYLFQGGGITDIALKEFYLSQEGLKVLHLAGGKIIENAYGLTATLYGECPVENGRMTSMNFDSYQIMRLAEMPKVETVIVPTYDFWGGVGEPTICVVAPSVLNAIAAATGKRVRSLPLKNVKLAKA